MSEFRPYSTWSIEEKILLVNTIIMDVISALGFLITIVFAVHIVNKIKSTNKIGKIKQNDRFMIAVIYLLAFDFLSLFAQMTAFILYKFDNFNPSQAIAKILSSTPPYLFIVACILNARNWA
jgi:hypothetical protein